MKKEKLVAIGGIQYLTIIFELLAYHILDVQRKNMDTLAGG